MQNQSDEALERRAYREAGHATMYYLIQGGYIEKYVPLDRSLILPPFVSISIDKDSSYFNKSTSSLSSSLPQVQVELAGHVAEQIEDRPGPDAGLARAMQAVSGLLEDWQRVIKAINFPHLPPDPPPVRPDVPLVTGAFRSIRGFLEELSSKSPDQNAVQNFQDMYPYVANNLQLHWPAVEALAQVLLERKALNQAEVIHLIEQELSEESKAKAKATLERMQQDMAKRIWSPRRPDEHRGSKKP